MYFYAQPIFPNFKTSEGQVKTYLNLGGTLTKVSRLDPNYAHWFSGSSNARFLGVCNSLEELKYFLLESLTSNSELFGVIFNSRLTLSCCVGDSLNFKAHSPDASFFPFDITDQRRIICIDIDESRLSESVVGGLVASTMPVGAQLVVMPSSSQAVDVTKGSYHIFVEFRKTVGGVEILQRLERLQLEIAKVSPTQKLIFKTNKNGVVLNHPSVVDSASAFTSARRIYLHPIVLLEKGVLDVDTTLRLKTQITEATIESARQNYADSIISNYRESYSVCQDEFGECLPLNLVAGTYYLLNDQKQHCVSYCVGDARGRVLADRVASSLEYDAGSPLLTKTSQYRPAMTLATEWHHIDYTDAAVMDKLCNEYGLVRGNLLGLIKQIEGGVLQSFNQTTNALFLQTTIARWLVDRTNTDSGAIYQTRLTLKVHLYHDTLRVSSFRDGWASVKYAIHLNISKPVTRHPVQPKPRNLVNLDALREACLESYRPATQWEYPSFVKARVLHLERGDRVFVYYLYSTLESDDFVCVEQVEYDYIANQRVSSYFYGIEGRNEGLERLRIFWAGKSVAVADAETQSVRTILICDGVKKALYYQDIASFQNKSVLACHPTCYQNASDLTKLISKLKTKYPNATCNLIGDLALVRAGEDVGELRYLHHDKPQLAHLVLDWATERDRARKCDELTLEEKLRLTDLLNEQQVVRVDLAEGRAALKQLYQKLGDGDGERFEWVQADTGCGKSYDLPSLLNNTQRNAFVCVRNNALLAEMAFNVRGGCGEKKGGENIIVAYPRTMKEGCPVWETFLESYSNQKTISCKSVCPLPKGEKKCGFMAGNEAIHQATQNQATGLVVLMTHAKALMNLDKIRNTELVIWDESPETLVEVVLSAGIEILLGNNANNVFTLNRLWELSNADWLACLEKQASLVSDTLEGMLKFAQHSVLRVNFDEALEARLKRQLLESAVKIIPKIIKNRLSGLYLQINPFTAHTNIVLSATPPLAKHHDFHITRVSLKQRARVRYRPTAVGKSGMGNEFWQNEIVRTVKEFRGATQAEKFGVVGAKMLKESLVKEGVLPEKWINCYNAHGHNTLQHCKKIIILPMPKLPLQTLIILALMFGWVDDQKCKKWLFVLGENEAAWGKESVADLEAMKVATASDLAMSFRRGYRRIQNPELDEFASRMAQNELIQELGRARPAENPCDILLFTEFNPLLARSGLI